MFMRKIVTTTFASAVAFGLVSASAMAAPVVLNPNFENTDVALNGAFGTGTYFIENWSPTNFATNSITDPGQYDNGSAGRRTVVGFLSGAGTSLSQVVQGFVAGMTYRVSVSVNGRAAVADDPRFTILADGVSIYGPAVIAPVDSAGTFLTAFTSITSDSFVAANTFVTISFANTSNSDVTATTLLTGVSVAAVPEPISLAILGVGLAGIGIARRRRA